MYRSTRTRTAAVFAAVGLAVGTSLLILAPTTAGAAPLPATITATTPATAPLVYTGINSQPAGDWTITVPVAPNVAAGDTLTLSVADSDGAGDCAVAGDGIGFAAVPSIANTTVGNTATFTAALSSTGTCVNNVLTLTATNTPSQPGPVLQLTNVSYNVGSAAKVGAVLSKIAPAAFTATNSNATISAVRAASANPAVLIPPSTPGPGGAPIGNVAIAEQRSNEIPAGAVSVCVQLLTPPAGTTFAVAPVPTVAASGGTGKGVPTVVTPTATTMAFGATASSTATGATTYTIAGLNLITGAGMGPVDAKVGFTCGGTQISQRMRLATVGIVDRIQGSDRFATAAQIAREQFTDLAGDTVVIARGDNFPDALAASYLAGRNDVPILLTNPADVPNETVQALKYHGVTNVVLVGGTSAISTGVAAFLDALPTYNFGSNTANAATLSVTRVGGADRYATAKDVAEFPGLALTSTANSGLAATCGPLKKTAIVASGENFPDALAAGGLAYAGMQGGCGAGALPLLLTNATGLNPSTVGALTNLNIKQVILMGGNAAVNDATKTGIESMGITVVRVGGATRQDTAVALANMALGTVAGGWDSGSFLVTRPDLFPDALTASSLSGNSASPLYLAASPTSLGTVTAGGIISYPVFYDTGVLLGGSAALSQAVFDQVAFTIAAQPSP
jgi:putative cell wall-binding protein